MCHKNSEMKEEEERVGSGEREGGICGGESKEDEIVIINDRRGE